MKTMLSATRAARALVCSLTTMFCLLAWAHNSWSCVASCKQSFPDCTFTFNKFERGAGNQWMKILKQQCVVCDSNGLCETHVYDCYECYTIPPAERQILNEMYGEVRKFFGSSTSSDVIQGNSASQKRFTAVTGVRGASTETPPAFLRGLSIFQGGSPSFGHFRLSLGSQPTEPVPLYIFTHGMNQNSFFAIQDVRSGQYIWGMDNAGVPNDALITSTIPASAFVFDPIAGKSVAELIFTCQDMPQSSYALVSFSQFTPAVLGKVGAGKVNLDLSTTDDASAWSKSGGEFRSPLVKSLQPYSYSSMFSQVTGPTTVTFKWKLQLGTTSAANMRLYVDNVVNKFLSVNQSNNNTWATVTVDIPAGTHTLEWAVNTAGNSDSEPDTSKAFVKFAPAGGLITPLWNLLLN